MAMLGFRTVNEMIGRVDKLKQKEGSSLNLDSILSKPKPLKGDTIYSSQIQDHGLDKALDIQILDQLKSAIKSKEKVTINHKIMNYNRTVGSIISSEITKLYGDKGLPSNTIIINFNGSAGQSFGAFLCKGMSFKLTGDSNDYFGKGLSGGKLVVLPSPSADFKAEENIIIGNVALYGATGGEAYIRGIAGERFCVRNSSAIAVVEGIGDHGCEYMTGGTVVVLGTTGRNFGAGMSGGIAYIYDKDQKFKSKFNSELCELSTVKAGSEDEKIIKSLIINHHIETKSEVASTILDKWDTSLINFKKVVPAAYTDALKKMNKKHSVKVIPNE
jgi:glutamate synthase domain-containing protein 3